MLETVTLPKDDWDIVMSHLKATCLFSGDSGLIVIHDKICDQLNNNRPSERRWFIPLRDAVKCEGSFEPEAVLPYFEEYLTTGEYDEVHGFLTWLVDNKKSFGHNLPAVFGEYLKTKEEELDVKTS